MTATPVEGGGGGDILNSGILNTLASIFIGSGKTTTSTTPGGSSTQSSGGQGSLDLQGIIDQANKNTNNPDLTSGIVQNIINQAAISFAPTAAQQNQSGMYNSSVLSMLSSMAQGAATAQSAQAVLNFNTSQQQIAGSAAAQLAQVNKSTTTTATSPTIQTSSTAPSVSPTNTLLSLGGGLLVNEGKSELLAATGQKSAGAAFFGSSKDGSEGLIGNGGLINTIKSTLGIGQTDPSVGFDSPSEGQLVNPGASGTPDVISGATDAAPPDLVANAVDDTSSSFSTGSSAAVGTDQIATAAGSDTLAGAAGTDLLSNAVDSGTGSTIGAGVGSSVGTEVGSQIGADLGTDVGSEVGTSVASDVGGEVASEAGSDIGSEVGSEVAADVASDVGSAAGGIASGVSAVGGVIHLAGTLIGGDEGTAVQAVGDLLSPINGIADVGAAIGGAVGGTAGDVITDTTDPIGSITGAISVICTALESQGKLPRSWYLAGVRDFTRYSDYGKKGYYIWAIWSAAYIRRSPDAILSKFLSLLLIQRAEYIASMYGVWGARKLFSGWCAKTAIWLFCAVLALTVCNLVDVKVPTPELRRGRKVHG